MSHAKWRAVRDLVRELSSGRRQVEFFQLVRLIECARSSPALMPPGAPAKHRPGTTPRLIDEAVRFRAAVAAHFQTASTLPAAGNAPPNDEAPATIETTFMSAAGAQGVLPAHYTMLILQRLRDGDIALKDFLDLFHHRLITSLVRAWEKYTPIAAVNWNAETAGDGQRAEPAADLFTRCVQSLTNCKRHAAPIGDDNILLFYSSIFSDRRRPAGSLAAILEDYFRVPARVQEFHPVRNRLRLEQRWRLPGRSPVDHPGPTLGRGILLGESVQVVQTCFLVQIGPLRLDEFRAYLPHGARFPSLIKLIRHFVGFEFVYTIQLLLKAAEAPEFRLGESAGPGVRLGQETWLLSGPTESDVLDDVQFLVAT